MTHYALARSGYYWVVEDADGTRCSGEYTDPALAEMRRASLQDAADRQARSRQRACLCCGNIFRSEGAHNRLCDTCRKMSMQMAG